MRSCMLGLSLACVVNVAEAQTVSDCDWRAAAQAIVEPWADNTRTYANGKTRLALLDTIEPAAGSLHMLVLSPPHDELGGRQCRVISLDGSTGFAAMTFRDLHADYDPARGLLFDIPVRYLDPSSNDITGGWLSFVVNQATGSISASIGPAD